MWCKWLLGLLLIWGVCCDNVLLVLDSTELTTTHSQMIEMLKVSNNVEIAYSFGTSKIKLKEYDRYLYDHVIVMCLSGKESESKLKTNEIVSFFDEGGNVVIVGDVDASNSYRKLFYSFGVEPDEFGSRLKDYYHHHQRADVLTTTNYVGAPFLSTNQPLLYQGIGLKLVNFDNYQLYELISTEATAISRNYIKKETQRLGRLTIAAGIQGLNNARALIIGSLGFFSNTAFETHAFGNKEAVQDLLGWVFQQKGILRVKNMMYHGEGADYKETVFNVGEKIYFQAELEIQRGKEWVPYSGSEDLQVEFVMLDPWVRAPLVELGNTSVYKSEFFAPSKEGIYQFKIIYKKPGYTFLTASERVTLRPYKHDEYERFLFVASPYLLGLMCTVVSTFMFILIYLYSSFRSNIKLKED